MESQLKSQLKKHILAPLPHDRTIMMRRLYQAALILGTGGLLTWMLLGSGDLPERSRPDVEPAPSSSQPDAFGGADPVKPVVVAIIDTGIDLDAFKDQLWTNHFEKWDGVDSDGNGLIDDVHGYNFAGDNHRIEDNHGHGTHVAGIIRQQLKLREALGLRGRPVQFMILKYFDPGVPASATMQASLRAFRYAVDHGADIINYSGGGGVPSAEEEQILIEAARRNILLVAAAGNEGTNSDEHPFFPAGYGTANIVSVGATDDSLSPVASSNFGRHTVDITATGSQVLSTLPSGRKGRMTGTSQATAFVTAAAALIMSEAEVPPRVERVIDQILATGRNYAHLSGRSRSGAQLDPLRAATQRDSQTTSTGLVMRNSRRIPAEFFAHEPSSFLDHDSKVLDMEHTN